MKQKRVVTIINVGGTNLSTMRSRERKEGDLTTPSAKMAKIKKRLPFIGVSLEQLPPHKVPKFGLYHGAGNPHKYMPIFITKMLLQ